MMRIVLLANALAALVALAGPAGAADCGNAATQTDMNACALRAYQHSDAALNEAYAAARRAMQAVSAEAGDALRDAQRAWIGYRDLACAAEAMPYRGGSIEPLVHAGCLERLTRQRTDDLRLLAGTD